MTLEQGLGQVVIKYLYCWERLCTEADERQPMVRPVLPWHLVVHLKETATRTPIEGNEQVEQAEQDSEEVAQLAQLQRCSFGGCKDRPFRYRQAGSHLVNLWSRPEQASMRFHRRGRECFSRMVYLAI